MLVIGHIYDVNLFLQLGFKREDWRCFVSEARPVGACVPVHISTTDTFPCLPNRPAGILTRRTTFK